MAWLNYILLILFAVVSFLLIGVVLIQKGRGGGLASAFGGGSGTATAFGSKTGDVLTWATSVIFGIFLLLAITMNLLANHAAAGGAPVRRALPSTPTLPVTTDPASIPPVLPTLPATPTPVTPTPAAPATTQP